MPIPLLLYYLKTIEEKIQEVGLLNDLRNINDVFRKDVAYDNIKSYKKAGFYLLSRKHIFGKSTGLGRLN